MYRFLAGFEYLPMILFLTKKTKRHIYTKTMSRNCIAVLRKNLTPCRDSNSDLLFPRPKLYVPVLRFFVEVQVSRVTGWVFEKIAQNVPSPTHFLQKLTYDLCKFSVTVWAQCNRLS
jgi:hypothetical protein